MATIFQKNESSQKTDHDPIRVKENKFAGSAISQFNESDDRGLQIAKSLALDFHSELNRQTRIYEGMKRLIDIVAATTLLILLIMPLLLIGLMVRLSDGGPVFFTQTRIGRFGRPFKCYKLRTMIPMADAVKQHLKNENDHGDSITFKIRRDPRITPLGRFLRKTSLDELPQLINVLSGEMSLVGPRPAVPSEVQRYTYRDHLRLGVKPGLTCLWQVNGRGDVPFEGQVEMDLDYINRRSLILDMKLIALTIPAVVSTRGAY